MSFEEGHFGYFIHKHKLTKSLTLHGHSRGANRTGLIIPELKLYLDAGVQNGMKADYVFLTHGHSDHCHGLNMIMADFDLSKDKEKHEVNVLAPEEIVKFLKDELNSFYAVTRVKYDDREQPIEGVKGGDKKVIKLNNRNYLVEVFKCDHSVPTVGFGLSEERTKLKKEYLGLKGKEIKELKDKGVEITETIYMPLFVFLGDTTTKVLDNYPQLVKYPNVIIECNFYDEEHIETSIFKQHVHWKFLKPYVIANPNTKFILIHFSLQYKMEDILKFFQEENLKNIHVWENNHKLLTAYKSLSI